GVGPDLAFVKKKTGGGGTPVHYEGYEYVSPDKTPAESIRMNMQQIRDDVDRDAKLTKPAGTEGGTVSQSGISKTIDHVEGHDLIAGIAAALDRLEETIAELVLLVVNDGNIPAGEIDQVKIVYPTCFNLTPAAVTAEAITDFQAILAASGDCAPVEIAG